MKFAVLPSLLLALFPITVLSPVAVAAPSPNDLHLEPGIPIYVSPDAPPPVLRAAEDLQRDLRRIFEAESPLVRDPEVLGERGCIAIAGPEADGDWGAGHPVGGTEAHRVFVAERSGNRHVVARGADMRGTIYAIYTVSEAILDIPPLWIWASWAPERRSSVAVPADTDLQFPSPAVRWRAWFPNDMDYYQSWSRGPAEGPVDPGDALHETMLRLKLNALDVGAITNGSLTGVSGRARGAADRGLVLLSTHTAPLGTRMQKSRWRTYWRDIRDEPVPTMTLDNEEALVDYWRHSIDTILDAGIETLWTVTLRGHGDVAFWERMEEAPETDAARADAIERIVRRQIDVLTERAGPDTAMRVTMYNEISDYFLGGLLRWPERPDLIWNFTAARRDHYPPDGLAEAAIPPEQPLGYYMNLQFTSTGSHVAQGEGPWKMAANFRAANALNERPLAFSIVNAGNIREFVMELTANARMMWDLEGFDADAFLRDFAGVYFGAAHAGAVADLYTDFYNAYWEQRAPDIPGFSRQYIFHDLRYGRALRDIIRRLERGETTDQPLGNGFVDLSFYQIDPAHTGAATIREALQKGTADAIPRWEAVVEAAESLAPAVESRGRRFFEDNLLVQARFMLAINRTLHAMAIAVAPDADAAERRAQLGQARRHFKAARAVLSDAEHGPFADWYPVEDERDLFRFYEIETALVRLHENAKAAATTLIPPERADDAGWVVLDDFGDAAPGDTLVERAGWSVEGAPDGFAIAPDPENPDNPVLLQRGRALEQTTAALRELPVPIDSRGTLYFRQYIAPSVDAPGRRQSWQLGLNSADKAGGTAWWDYSVRAGVDFNEHRALDGRLHATPMQPYAWYNFWFVVDRAQQALEIYRTRGANEPGPVDRITAGEFGEAAGDLSVLKLSRSGTGRDWRTWFDAFHLATDVLLTVPETVAATPPESDSARHFEAEAAWAYGGEPHPFRVTAPRTASGEAPAYTVLYLKNLPGPRLGTDTDATIIADMLTEGLAVVEVDAAGLPDTSPELERALLDFYQRMRTLVPKASGGRAYPDDRRTYWLPAGYRLKRDIPFWNIAEHGVHGSLDWIMRVHNRHVVEEHGRAPVETPEELHGRDGGPLDYNLYLDLMYPSGSPPDPVPVIAQYATLSHRPASFRSGERPMEPLGWLLDGYAMAYVDHIYNPLARHENYGHFQPGYTLESWNGVAAGSAALRFLRAHADDYNLTDRIGALGHSKSSYSVVRIADPRHPEQKEHRRFDDFPEGSPEPQPWADHAGHADVAFASMGNGTRRTQYFSQHMAPTVVAVGRHDRFNHWDVFPKLVAACEKADMLHLALWMDDLGHDRPFGIDRASGKDRNLLIRRFFAQHLRPDQNLEVLFIVPRADQDDVPLDGVTRILAPDDELPDDMAGVNPFSPIAIQFSRSIDLDTAGPAYLDVRDTETGAVATGQWTPSLENSRFHFTPDPPLRPDTEYAVYVATGIRDTEGRTLARRQVQRFRTAAGEGDASR